MSRILFLSSYYLGAATANGICARNITAQLKSLGHDVHVLCYASGETEENVYTVPCPTLSGRGGFVGKVWRALRAVITPGVNKKLVNAYKAAALQLCREKAIDTLVCTFFPLESVPIATAVKKAFPHIKTILYEVDSVGDGIFSGSKYQALTNKAMERWSARHYRYADRVIVMQSHEDYWRKTFGKKFGHKLALADIPVLVEKPLPAVDKAADAPVSFLYGGLMERAYRSPRHLLDVFHAYGQDHAATLDFYSKGDCEDMVARVAEETAGITQHGYVPQDVLDEAVAHADVLVSIGNRVSRSVPSKLITYLSYGKPVVHFSSQKEDVCAEYLEKYPLGLVLNEWDTVEENARKLALFVEHSRGKTVRFEEVAQLLKMNTPAYSAEIIASM